jgi:hypothetical protein
MQMEMKKAREAEEKKKVLEEEKKLERRIQEQQVPMKENFTFNMFDFSSFLHLK